MSGILNAAAARTNASTAGHTYVDSAEATPGTPVAGTITESIARVIPSASGALHSIFNMEPATASADGASTAHVTPTSSTKGPHGGRVPAAVSRILSGSPTDSPGPGPQTSPHPLPAKATEVASGVKTDVVATAGHAKATGTTALASIRRRLGI